MSPKFEHPEISLLAGLEWLRFVDHGLGEQRLDHLVYVVVGSEVFVTRNAIDIDR